MTTTHDHGHDHPHPHPTQPDSDAPLTYHQRLEIAVREPRSVLAEFGTTLPDGVAVRVHDSTADMRYLVLPMRPEGTDGMDEAALAELVTRDSMIGVTQVKASATSAAV